MNKKEISEIKKLFTKEHCRIDHISADNLRAGDRC